MSEWIKVNLPFKKYIYADHNDPFPDLSERMKSVFGKTIEKHNMNFSFEDSCAASDLVDGMTKKEKASLIKTNKLAHRKISKKMNDWIDKQPETIAWNDRADQRNIERKELEKKTSFCGAGLNKAGTLIEVEENNKLIKYLIGDINELGGVCDDCHIPNDVIVKRYKIVYEK